MFVEFDYQIKDREFFVLVDADVYIDEYCKESFDINYVKVFDAKKIDDGKEYVDIKHELTSEEYFFVLSRACDLMHEMGLEG